MSNQDAHHQFTRLTCEALLARATGMLGGFVANVFIVRAMGAEGQRHEHGLSALHADCFAGFFRPGNANANWRVLNRHDVRRVF